MAISSNALWGCLLADLNNHSSVFRVYPDSPCFIGEIGRPFGHSADIFAGDALLRSAIKKCTDGADKAACEAAAVAQLVEINESFLSREHVVDVSQLGPYDEVILGEFRRSMYNFWTPKGYPLLDHGMIASHVDHGPGSSPGVDETSFYHKMGDSALCAPNTLIIEMYYEWVKGSPLRVDTEIGRLLRYGPPTVSESNRISFIPKTTEPPMARGIAPEPSLGMFFQKGIQALMEKQLILTFGVDLSTQPVYNQALAKAGSCTGMVATVDLEAASDRISWDFCKEFIPKQSFFWLNATRTPMIKLPDGRVLKQAMMATMGNAWCFPLETVIFCCLVEAVYKAMGIPFQTHCPRTLYSRVSETAYGTWEHVVDRRDSKNWGVFGDDIIVHKDAYEPLCRLLRAFGMKPNARKSFNSGSFRESCGADYYEGTNVRGVYVKSLKTPQDVAIAYNSLFDWSVLHQIRLDKTLSLLRGEGGHSLGETGDTSAQKAAIPLVPPWEQPDAGIRVPLEVAIQHGCVWIHRKVKPDAICSPLSGHFLYQRFVPEPRRLNVEVRAGDGREPNNHLNGSSVLLSAVRSMLRGGWITLRSWVPAYTKGRGICPNWDWYPTLDPRFNSEALRNAWIKASKEGWSD